MESQKPMPSDFKNEAKVLFTWMFPEYVKEQRDKKLLIIIGIIFAAMITYAIYTKNFLFVIILLLVIFIMFIREMQEPLDIRFVITDKGIFVGERFYLFSELHNFWILIEHPHFNNLYFQPKNKWKTEINIPLLSQNASEIRQTLLKYLKEDINKEDESIADVVGRFLKL